MIPKVSFIISVFDQLDYTKRCLSCLEKTLKDKLAYEVLIVDDGSDEETIHYLHSLKDPHHVTFNSEREGFAKNNNLAASHAKGEYLCLLNNDVFVEGDWLLPMIKVFEEKENVGVVGNVQRLAFSKKYDHMGVVFGPLGNPRHYGQGFYHRPFKGEIKQWSAVTAACCLVRSKDFLEIGGFDEIYINGCEDVDLCLRYNRNGCRNFIAHDSIVTHVKGASEGRKRFNDQNSQVLQEKWGDEIKRNETVNDQVLHARNYIYRGIFRPLSTNFLKWIEALLIYFRFKKL
jgi:GT2 family glycosyltransferase